MQHKVADYQRHIDQLCKKYNIKVEWRENTRARAWRKSRQMRLCPIRSGITYAVALHELGHIHGPQTGARLNRETQAWIWAKETAICWHNPMNNVMRRSLQSYLRWCVRRKKAWVPPKEHLVWSLAEVEYLK